MTRPLSRRRFLAVGGASAGALALGAQTAGARPRTGFGPVEPDRGGMLDLPRGFRYRVVQQEGGTLTGGVPVPGDFDGMAAYPGAGGTTVLVRNHELRGQEPPAVPGANPYDPAESGGTTAVVVGPDRREVRSFVTNSGTRNNCAGGRTPWGTWLTCEEDRTDGHGYVFEVDPRDPENALSRTPIRGMGFFSHEATGNDPDTGIVYLTEDDFRGRIAPDPADDTRSSFLFRYVPEDRRQRPGALQRGGRLQALAVDEAPRDADFFRPGQRFGVRWLDVDAEEPHDDALAKGCLRFNRLEGADFTAGAFWFSDTAGGEARLGQIFRYLPAENRLELFYEGTDANEIESPDNIVVTPWGDLWFAEDGPGGNRLMGITPDGGTYTFASNRLSDSELAGPTFSPDGRTFFVNIQNPGVTYAVWGPFPRADRGRRHHMARADAPAGLRPRIGAETADAAARQGLTDLEAAALERAGVTFT